VSFIAALARGASVSSCRFTLPLRRDGSRLVRSGAGLGGSGSRSVLLVVTQLL